MKETAMLNISCGDVEVYMDGECYLHIPTLPRGGSHVKMCPCDDASMSFFCQIRSSNGAVRPAAKPISKRKSITLGLGNDEANHA